MAEQLTMNLILRAFISLLPVLMGLFLVVLVNLPLSLTGGLVPAPLLALAPVYFWALVRPDLMPPVAALGVGLFEDLLSGGAPGVWAGAFLAAFALADRQRDSFAGMLGAGAVLGFASAMFVAAGVAYVLAALAYWQFAPLAPILVQCAVTIALYPLLALVMGRLHRHYIGSLRSD
jgi:rod shape-determining protein MreD